VSLSHESVGRQLADLQYYGIDRIGPVRSLWQGHDEYQKDAAELPMGCAHIGESVAATG